MVDGQRLIDCECTLLLARDKGVWQIHAHARDADYSVLPSFPWSSEYRARVYIFLRVSRVGVCCPPSIAHGCVLSSEERASVCVVLRVSRVGMFSLSSARGCVVLRVSCVGLCCLPSIARARKCILPALLSFAVINYSQSMYTRD